MADLDTANKRFSAMLIGCPWRGINIFPSGTVDGAARQSLLFLYSGILAGIIVNSGRRLLALMGAGN